MYELYTSRVSNILLFSCLSLVLVVAGGPVVSRFELFNFKHGSNIDNNNNTWYYILALHNAETTILLI